jgi:Na+/H+ antiporter NhaD/arsenite permease-like protein
MKKRNTYIKRFVRNIRRTYKNKLVAIALLACSLAPAILDNDGTALLFISMFAVPLFFAKNNWIYY